jgi:hypothetical protein
MLAGAGYPLAAPQETEVTVSGEAQFQDDYFFLHCPEGLPETNKKEYFPPLNFPPILFFFH